MAQLRCAQTSEVLFEGSPLEVATAAAAFDPGDVLFDGVGGADGKGKTRFDAAAVRDYRSAELAGLEAALADVPARAPNGATAEERDALKRQRDALAGTIAERKDRIAAGEAAVAPARAAMDAARRRVEDRKAEDARRHR